MKRLTIDIPDELHEAIQIATARGRTNIKCFVTRAIKEKLKNEENVE